MGYEYLCSAGETFDSVALAVYGDEKYVAELMAANGEYLQRMVFSGGERLVLPETGTLAWSCGCWVLASFAGARLAIRGRGEGTLPAALAAALAAYPLAWLAGVALGDPSFREGGLYLTAALFAGAAAAGLLGSGRPRKKRRDPRAPIRKPARRK